jgi:hypothetical protein
MSRPIRFRIWDIKACRWIGLEAYVGAGYGDLNDACENIIVQQFTGLTDSKGRDIYEGDIMENANHRGDVCFDNGEFYIRPVIELRPGEPHYMGTIYWGTVIGNAMENPDLLK